MTHPYITSECNSIEPHNYCLIFLVLATLMTCFQDAGAFGVGSLVLVTLWKINKRSKTVANTSNSLGLPKLFPVVLQDFLGFTHHHDIYDQNEAPPLRDLCE
jgi:hypothetical protein